MFHVKSKVQLYFRSVALPTKNEVIYIAEQDFEYQLAMEICGSKP